MLKFLPLLLSPIQFAEPGWEPLVLPTGPGVHLLGHPSCPHCVLLSLHRP